jgi:hypothetical protein
MLQELAFEQVQESVADSGGTIGVVDFVLNVQEGGGGAQSLFVAHWSEPEPETATQASF